VKKIDIVAALVLLGLSALIAIDTWGLPYWSTFAPGPAFASLWVALAGGIIGAVLLFQALVSKDDEEADWPDKEGARQVLLGIAALWLLLALLPYLGTIISGMLFMLLFLLVVGRRPWVPSLFTAVLTVGLIEVVFVHWLNIHLPKGVFGF